MPPGELIPDAIIGEMFYFGHSAGRIFDIKTGMNGVDNIVGRGIAPSRLSIGAGRYIDRINILAAEVIELAFIPYPKKDKETAGDPHRQSQYIDDGVTAMPDHITPGNLEKILDHSYSFYSLRNALTGFSKAARTAWKLIVTSVIPNAASAV